MLKRFWTVWAVLLLLHGPLWARMFLDFHPEQAGLAVAAAPLDSGDKYEEPNRREAREPDTVFRRPNYYISDNLRFTMFSTLADENDVPRYISWGDFLKKNQGVVEQFTQKIQIATQLFSSKEVKQAFDRMLTAAVEAGRPDYAAETKGMRYIYLADASDHDTKSIVQEVSYLLERVRESNPQAHILLALEFANNTDLNAAPIHFPGKDTPHILLMQSYAGLLPLAERLDMDVLALDDFVLYENGFKLGKFLVNVDLSDPAVQRIIGHKKELTAQDLLVLRDFASRSSGGMYARNEQWSNYLRAAEGFYDIIIVYCGLGHLSPVGTLHSVQELVGTEYAEFDFYTEEELPEEIRKQYAEANKRVSRNRADVSSREYRRFFNEVLSSGETIINIANAVAEKMDDGYVYMKLTDEEPYDDPTGALGKFFVVLSNGWITKHSKAFNVYMPDLSAPAAPQ